MAVVEKFNSLKELFVCTICCTSLAVPTEIQCGHIFCAPCVQVLQKTNPTESFTAPSCPLCKTRILRRGLKIRYDLEELQSAIRNLQSTILSQENVLRDSCESSSSSSDSDESQVRPIMKLFSKRTSNIKEPPNQQKEPLITEDNSSSPSKILNIEEPTNQQKVTLITDNSSSPPKILNIEESPNQQKEPLIEDNSSSPPNILKIEEPLNQQKGPLITEDSSSSPPVILNIEEPPNQQKVPLIIDNSLSPPVILNIEELPSQQKVPLIIDNNSSPPVTLNIEEPHNQQKVSLITEDNNSSSPPKPLDLRIPIKESLNSTITSHRYAIRFIKPLDLSVSKRRRSPSPELEIQSSKRTKLASPSPTPVETVTSNENRIYASRSTLFSEMGESEIERIENQVQLAELAYEVEKLNDGNRTEYSELTKLPIRFKEVVEKEIIEVPIINGERDEEEEEKLAISSVDPDIYHVPAATDKGESEFDVSFLFATPEKSSTKRQLDLPPPTEARKFIFCPSRLKRSQLVQLNELCQLCGGTISKDYTDDVTHLIINLDKSRVPQTMKYLLAIADKKWIVIIDWVGECLNQHKIVDEGPYETSNFADCDPGVRKSRTSDTTLFIGINFYFSGVLKNSGAPDEECKRLVKKLGGSIVSSPYVVDENIIIIGEGATKSIFQEWYRTRGLLTISWNWIIDCVLTYNVVPFSRSHIITNLDGKCVSQAALPRSLININQSSPFGLFRSQ